MDLLVKYSMLLAFPLPDLACIRPVVTIVTIVTNNNLTPEVTSCWFLH